MTTVGLSLSVYFFLPGRCVRADPAAVFAAGDDFGSLSTFDAADAAFALVTSPFFAMTFSVLCGFALINYGASRVVAPKPRQMFHRFVESLIDSANNGGEHLAVRQGLALFGLTGYGVQQGAETMTPGEFIAKWRAAELKESSAAQEHFIDLCHLLVD